jgi:hypothetical protein
VTPRAPAEPDAPRTGLAKPGVRTVRIGAGPREAELDTVVHDEPATTNLLGAPVGNRARRPVPLWASRLLAVLAVVAALAVIVLLLL